MSHFPSVADASALQYSTAELPPGLAHGHALPHAHLHGSERMFATADAGLYTAMDHQAFIHGQQQPNHYT